MKQDIFAQRLGVTQQMVSLYEGQEVIDDKTLEKCAEVLKVPVEILKNMPAEEDGKVIIFKDFQKTSDTSNQVENQVASPLRDYVINNYTNPEVLSALNDTIQILKADNKALRKEIAELRAELKNKE